MNTRPFLISRLKEEWNNLDPVDPLRGLIADAIDALAEQPAQEPHMVVTVNHKQAFVEGLKPQQQEPVAWIFKPTMELLWLDEIEVKDPSKHRGYKPLYTSPQPSKPLTDEQLWENDQIMSLNADLGWHMDTIRMFARAIEAAHGIKGDA